MLKSVRKFAALAAIILGSAHLLYGVIAFRALTPEHLWFAGAGVAMICVGLSHWQKPARLQAGLMSIYLGIMAVVMPMPQVFVGLAIFLTLLISDRQTAYA